MFPDFLRVPYGYDLKQAKLVRNEEEMKIISLMKEWREVQGLSFDKIATNLNSLNLPTKRRALWQGRVVQRILQREVK